MNKLLLLMYNDQCYMYLQLADCWLRSVFCVVADTVVI